MADEAPTTARPISTRRRWRWFLLVLPVIALGGYFVYDLVRPRTEEERVLEAYEDFIEAMIEEDFEAAWEFVSKNSRATFAYRMREFSRSERLSSSVPEFWAELRRSGLSQSDFEALDHDGVFLATLKAMIELHPRQWQQQVNDIQRLTVDSVELLGGGVGEVRSGLRAAVILHLDGRHLLTVSLVKENGDWWVDWGWAPLHPPYWRLGDRKVGAGLPLSHRSESIGVVIEVGDEQVSQDTVEKLNRILQNLADSCREADKDHPGVLLDLHPDQSINDVMKVVDAAMLAHFEQIVFADTITTTPAPGIRINGVPLDEIEDVTALPDVRDHPALKRMIVATPEPEDAERIREVWRRAKDR